MLRRNIGRRALRLTTPLAPTALCLCLLPTAYWKRISRVTTPQHAARMGLFMAGAAVLLGWVFFHTETNFADGLRYIHQAEQIDRGDGEAACSAGSTTRSTRWRSPQPTACWEAPARPRGSGRRSCFAYVKRVALDPGLSALPCRSGRRYRAAGRHAGDGEPDDQPHCRQCSE